MKRNMLSRPIRIKIKFTLRTLVQTINGTFHRNKFSNFVYKTWRTDRHAHTIMALHLTYLVHIIQLNILRLRTFGEPVDLSSKLKPCWHVNRFTPLICCLTVLLLDH
jgi:hypothetical protein